MRSLMLGDCDHYQSPYMLGVKQAMSLLGHEHAEVSIRLPIGEIADRVSSFAPSLVWTHMILWPPRGSPAVYQLIDVVTKASRAGAKVVIHDGDYKAPTRYPHDLSRWCSLALVNHDFDRSAWCVPVLAWPYFAFAQQQIAAPVPSLRCALWFAGTVGTGPVYAERTALLGALRSRGVQVRMPTPADGNTLMRTAEIAASADAVLGFGRPSAAGWVDTRVFQYPGAGAILVHDDARGYLRPDEHFIEYRSGDADSVVAALRRLRAMSAADRMAMRRRAFAHVQAHHSSIARVREVCTVLGISQ